MTRDGDVIEIGCHSGSKTWTLTCDANKWIGAVGYCGQYTASGSQNNPDDVKVKKTAAAVWNVSPST